MNAFLSSVRRRLRLAWGSATVQWVLPALAAAALLTVLVGRVRPWVWPERAAFAVVLAPLVAVLGAAVVVRIPTLVTARAADRGLATHDAFATALELRTRPADAVLGQLVERRAESLASGRRGRDAVPLTAHTRRLLVAAGLLALAVGLAVLPNHQDDVRARRAAAQAALAAEAAKARALADELGARPETARTADALRALADALVRAPSLERGQAELDRTIAQLGAAAGPAAVAQKTAAVGLERSLAATPLPGVASGQAGAAAQLAAAAAATQNGALDAAQRQQLAQRLQALAAGQSVGSPEVSSALAVAAAALSAGDQSTASAALARAATAQQAANDAVAGRTAAEQAALALADSRASLAGRAATGARGTGAGQGQGQGKGQGKGPGQGTGQGQGAGSGQGQGQGAPSGQVGGSNAATASGAQGGQGTANGSGRNPSTGLNTSVSVYDPQAHGGDQLVVGGDGSDGPGAQQGKATGPNVASGSMVPLGDVVAGYQAQATKALTTMTIPASQRDVVRAYFEGLAKP